MGPAIQDNGVSSYFFHGCDFFPPYKTPRQTPRAPKEMESWGVQGLSSMGLATHHVLHQQIGQGPQPYAKLLHFLPGSIAQNKVAIPAYQAWYTTP